MELLKFIEDTPDWKEVIVEEPYCIKIKEESPYIILNYDQIKSDFSIPLVRECRGIILREYLPEPIDYGALLRKHGKPVDIPRTSATYKVVCYPFKKFFNYGEGNCDEIDWSTARVEPKIDGAIIKVWHDDGWHVSTMSCIDARKAPVHFDPNKAGLTFYDVFSLAVNKARIDIQSFDPNFTYIFELTSKYTRVVVPYDEPEVWSIGLRDNRTYLEHSPDFGVKSADAYVHLRTLDECLAAAKQLPFSEEGYVVVDANWNRVKIKSPAYVAVHHLKGNNGFSLSKIIELVRTGEDGEVLNYFPEFTEDFEKVRYWYDIFVDGMRGRARRYSRMHFETQKEFAEHAVAEKFSGYYFAWRKNPALTPEEWFRDRSLRSLVDEFEKVLKLDS